MSLINETPAANPKRNQQQLLIIGVVVVAVIAVIAAVVLSNSNSTSGGINYSAIPQSRAADGGFVLGNPDANVTIIEFADYACPHCQSYKPVMDRFIKEYVAAGKAKYELRVFATAGGQMTMFTGSIAACLDDQRQGAFWDASELFYAKATQGKYTQDVARVVTQELGLDYNKALTCVNEKSQVVADMEFGQRVGIGGTPAVAVRYGDGEARILASETYEALMTAVAAGA